MTTFDLKFVYPLYLKKSEFTNKHIDTSKPFYNIKDKDMEISLHTFLKLHVKPIEVETKDTRGVRACVMLKKLMDSELYMNAFIILLKETDIKTSLDKIMNIVYANYYMHDVSFEDIMISKVMQNIYEVVKRVTYVYLNEILAHPYFVKTQSLNDLEWFINKKIVCICLDENTKLNQKDKKRLFEAQIPLIKTKSLDKIHSIFIDYDTQNVSCNKEDTSKSVSMPTSFNYQIMLQSEDNKRDDDVYFHDMSLLNKNFYTLSADLSFLNEHLKVHDKNKHAFLLPQLNDINTASYIHFFNQLNKDIDVTIYLRGGTHLSEFLFSYHFIQSELRNKDMMKHTCLIIDTDELSLHINQIKKSSKIDYIMIDIDQLNFDIFDEENDQVMTKSYFKTHYLEILKEMHSHLRIQGISHAIYSKHLGNKDIYTMLKTAGFKKILIDETCI
jgi:hypothetical protein